MEKIIDLMKMKMSEAIEKHGISSKEALDISQELDILISIKQKEIYNDYCRGI